MPHLLPGPDPTLLHPLPAHPRVMFIRNLPNLPSNIEIGEYTYYDDPDGPAAFQRNVLYHFAFTGDQLRIGRFCALATGMKFIMNGANHRLDGPSSYPFVIFGGAWASRFAAETSFPIRGDTVIGSDVWLGYDSLILPGVTIGHGAVVGARAVVTRDVPPYAVVAGNPATVRRMRFDAETVALLLDLRWWDWPVEVITEHLPLISGGDARALAAVRHDTQG